MARNEKPPTGEELVLLAQDVCYEIEMALAAAGRLVDLRDVGATRPLSDDEGVQQNAWLEVFVLHARNMHDFFEYKPERDDVTAGHFVEGWSTDGNENFDLLHSLQRQTNKHLAHITAERRRVPVEQRGWPWFEMGKSLLELWQEFCDQLGEPQREWFRLDPDHW